MATRLPRPRHNRDRQRQPTLTAVPWASLVDRTAAGLAVCLLVARPLFPSEDAETGSGLVVVALWGLAALLWAVSQAIRQRLIVFASWVDLGPMLLLVLVLASAVSADTPRPAINMSCEWIALGLSYLLIRQLFRSPASQRFLAIAMLSTAFTLAAYGIYQSFWGLDSLREDYARDRLSILQSLDIAPGSAQEETFRNRLNSHEPFATFALANSLAGFLLAWTPLAFVWSLSSFLSGVGGTVLGARGEGSTRRGLPRVLCAAIFALTILIALILTQSRTAYVGLILQLTLLSLAGGGALWWRLRQQVSAGMRVSLVLTSFAVVAGTVLLAWQRGKIDEMVFTQATKSLGYRWQYWRATVQLIREQPWQGTGPGNFRGHYLRYKLAESSEEIADPHNFLLELTATSGLPAGAVLVGTLGLAIAVMLRRRPVVEQVTASAWSADLLFAGGAAFLLAMGLSSIGSSTYGTLFVAWCLASGMIGCVMWGWEIDSRVIACSLAGLLVHLLGAGGIGMPGVAQSLWALVALGLNASERDRAPYERMGSRWTRPVLLGVSAGWALFCALVLRPVTGSVSAVSLGQRLMSNRDWAGAEGQFRLAAERDGLWAEPWLQLSRIHYERWQGGHGRAADEQFDYAVMALEQAKQLAPSRLEPIRLLAELYEAKAERVSAFWVKAAEEYGRCVELYPTNAALQARYAHALWLAGKTDSAVQSAQRAWQLDAQTPHLDRKLTEAERKLLEPLQALQPPVE